MSDFTVVHFAAVGRVLVYRKVTLSIVWVDYICISSWCVAKIHNCAKVDLGEVVEQL